MPLAGSCHCGAIRFRAVSHSPYPWCFCGRTRCRKTHGGIGGVVSFMAEAEGLEVEGAGSLSVCRTQSNPPGPGLPPAEPRLHDGVPAESIEDRHRSHALREG